MSLPRMNFLELTLHIHIHYRLMLSTVSAQPIKMNKFGILLFVLSIEMIKIEATSRFREVLDSSFPGNGNFDYKDALSKSIMFFDGQRSSVLPPNQILTWRKDSALGFNQNVWIFFKNIRITVLAFHLNPSTVLVFLQWVLNKSNECRLIWLDDITTQAIT